MVVRESANEVPAQAAELMVLYDRCLPEVYGYLLARCRSVPTAEDLTSETFVAAAAGVRRGTIPQLTPAWLIGVARHKLVDHWRREAAENRRLRAVEVETAEVLDDWDAQLDSTLTRQVLGEISPAHRLALVLRHCDGLSVTEVARHLDRTVHATEALLVRARISFRRTYEAATEGGLTL